MPVDTDILPARYRSPERVARGGMGDIYRATDSTLGRVVAVKLLAEHYARDEAVRRRFTREALAAARLSGEPHVVMIFDVGEHAGRPFIVMEYLNGGSLEERLRKEGAPEPGQALDWLEQAARALDAAHRHGVVHRDVKPANLLLDRNGDVHVVDFGIASAAGMDSLTMTGTVLGTAGYLSPEQAQGERATPASDRYALAVVAFELLSGRRPFESDSLTAEATAHVNEPVPSIAAICEGLPAELDAVFRQAMAKDPGARFGTAAEFVAALRAALARAAGATRPLQPVISTPSLPPSLLTPVHRRRSRGGRWTALAALLALGAAGGAIAAIALTGGGSSSKATLPPRERTVTTVVTRQGSTGQTTTARSTTAGTTASSSLSGSQLNDTGYAKLQAGDFNGALPLLQQAVAKLNGVGYPTEAYANYNLGYTLFKLGRCSDAVQYLERAKKLEPFRSEPKAVLKQAKRC